MKLVMSIKQILFGSSTSSMKKLGVFFRINACGKSPGCQISFCNIIVERNVKQNLSLKDVEAHKFLHQLLIQLKIMTV